MGMERDIRFEATVAPGFADLLVASRRAFRLPPPQADPPDPACSDPAGLSLPETDGPWPRIALRRDGGRPLCFAGLTVLSADSEIAEDDGLGGSAQRRFRLFVTPERRLVAHLAVVPAETLPARPIHRAAYLDDPADLAGFLAANDPSDCAAVLPRNEAIGAFDALWAGLRLALPLSPGHCAGSPPTEG